MFRTSPPMYHLLGGAWRLRKRVKNGDKEIIMWLIRGYIPTNPSESPAWHPLVEGSAQRNIATQLRQTERERVREKKRDRESERERGSQTLARRQGGPT